VPENFDRFDPSRSFKVIGTDTDRSATYDFLLVFHSDYGRISIDFEINDNICKKNSHPVHLTPQLREFALEPSRNGSKTQKLE